LTFLSCLVGCEKKKKARASLPFQDSTPLFFVLFLFVFSFEPLIPWASIFFHFLEKHSKHMVCGLCKEEGHNRRTCPQAGKPASIATPTPAAIAGDNGMGKGKGKGKCKGKGKGKGKGEGKGKGKGEGKGKGPPERPAMPVSAWRGRGERPISKRGNFARIADDTIADHLLKHMAALDIVNLMSTCREMWFVVAWSGEVMYFFFFF
jgi:hypothetical protein